jgi:hypothetical protein
MAFPLKSILGEPESQSIMFFLANSLVLIYVLLFVVTWHYTLFYLVAHVTVFFVIIKRLSGGRLYTSKKSLSNQTVIVTGAAAGIGRVTAVELAKLQQQWTIGPVDGEIVPVYGEMLHPTKSHTYQGEMERKNLTIYIYIYI